MVCITPLYQSHTPIRVGGSVKNAKSIKEPGLHRDKRAGRKPPCRPTLLITSELWREGLRMVCRDLRMATATLCASVVHVFAENGLN